LFWAVRCGGKKFSPIRAEKGIIPPNFCSMKIFLSYARQDGEQAKLIYLALRDQGHSVFFDRADLPAGDEYHNRIREAIQDSGLFIFLASPLALDAGSYTLTELEIAEKSRRRLLPVLLGGVEVATLPPALKTVTVLQPGGNVVASVAAEVHRIARKVRRSRLKQLGAALCILGLLGAGVFYAVEWRGQDQMFGKDGAPAALILAGSFIMGDDEESPRREIYLDSFYLDRYEVTVGRYANFLHATGNVKKPESWPEADLNKMADFAVIGVDWHDADQYCRWAGKRLPTEAEWERAARGGDERRYPWGLTEPIAAHARFAISGDKAVYPDGVSAVGKHSAGAAPLGIHDLAGNASEWVADWYAPGFSRAQTRNPKGPDSGSGKVIRGGGWMDPAARITTTKRMYLNPGQRMEDIGFRCARDAK
jgi:sulfatase modifying factor 1